jgi:hypothetical protein
VPNEASSIASRIASRLWMRKVPSRGTSV